MLAAPPRGGVTEIVSQISGQEHPQHLLADAVTRVGRDGLQQQEDALSNVPIGIGVSTNQVYELMAEGKAAKELIGSGLLVPGLLELLPDFLSRCQMGLIGWTINKQSPIQIASYGPFTPCEGSKHDERGVLRHQPLGGYETRQPGPFLKGGLPCCPQMADSETMPVAEALKG